MSHKSREQNTVLGLDLAGVSHRPSGVCLLQGFQASTSLLYSDEEILSRILEKKPRLVGIDAPLSLPPGRRSMAEQNGAHFRPCDEELRRRRIPFFPITLGPMRMLTERGIRLSLRIERMGFQTAEIYPGGAQDILRIPRAKKDKLGLKRGLERLGIRGLSREATAHELDAATGALVALYFLQGRAEIYGDLATGAILMPSL